ncbi:hypothetical protein KC325_g54 [Hortaea werneckii]|nr:hypothetical protein KC325_g54 [Hortaea werneckii]
MDHVSEKFELLPGILSAKRKLQICSVRARIAQVVVGAQIVDIVVIPQASVVVARLEHSRSFYGRSAFNEALRKLGAEPWMPLRRLVMQVQKIEVRQCSSFIVGVGCLESGELVTLRRCDSASEVSRGRDSSVRIQSERKSSRAGTAGGRKFCAGAGGSL